MIKRVYQRWVAMVGPAVTDREVAEELRFHLEMQTQELVRQGMLPFTARAEAMRRFGDLVAVHRQCVQTRRRNRVVFRALRSLLGVLLLSGTATRVLGADIYVQHVGELLIAIGALGLVLLAIRIARPAELPNAGSTFSSTV